MSPPQGESRTRAKQIDAKLRKEPWEAVGCYAAFCAQIASLGLQPWESTLVYADSPESHALLRGMKAAGLSKYEPDPLAALAEFERKGRRDGAFEERIGLGFLEVRGDHARQRVKDSMSDTDGFRKAAIQYLGWAVEEIEKVGNPEAARHACAALKCLQEATPSQDARPAAI
ncbi:hypothetical protein IVB55_18005 [Bradyrhizobium sp. CW4]|uniref:hypothetical protein n=1 Tax=Bradyrhizobium sp. CW4 TaxID=2782687 RepID=UPI001FFC182D|nr:hypothetical protein [Bradyrhizobium sp. CW4]MCK1414833.1 hypothetical protein [Bradyrhizobium sp. CW4]